MLEFYATAADSAAAVVITRGAAEPLTAGGRTHMAHAEAEA
jgi:hypothetical protein